MRNVMKSRCVRLVPAVTVAVAVAFALPVVCGPAFAAPAASGAPDAPPAASGDEPGTTLLPPLPVRLGEDNPCTGASDRTAT
ncbi:hypothetical protein, partial [Streptomyces prasinus]|uniref:hypothetical protein n=1 Tax=Streptomyces prasinus TaxID=67345 RepID=UPI00147055BE